MRAAAALVLLATVALAGKVVYTVPLHRELAGRFELVDIDHRYGDVVVTGTGQSEGVVVDGVARVTASTAMLAQSFADGIELVVHRSGSSAVVKASYPRVDSRDPELSYELDLTVKVPSRIQLELDNSFGDVHLSDIRGGCRLANRYGSIELERCGRCEVDGRYGNVRTVAAAGPQVLRHAYGDVWLAEPADSVHVENRYGSVGADQTSGPVFIENLLGNVVARRGQGRMSLANRMGDIAASVEDPDLSRLAIMSRLGHVDLSVARGLPFQIGGRTRRGSITGVLPAWVQAVDGGESVSGSSGTGGPVVEFEGLWSSFVIREDTVPVRGTVPSAGR